MASKLLKTMPVVQDSDFGEDSWIDWLQGHLLFGTRNHLISDLRDPFPFERRSWVSEDKSENLPWEITSTDFLDMLYTESESEIWINIGSDWNEYIDGHNETISTSSILIPKHLGNSFLQTITNFDNHMRNEAYLSNFCDNNMRVNLANHQFKGKEWLTREHYVYGLDKNDPYAGDIDPRMFAPEDIVVERFDLRSCKYGKKWFIGASSRASIINELWSDEKPLDPNTYYRTGIRCKASMEFLLTVCRELDVEIAIQVNMKRSLVGRYNKESDDNYGYIPKYSKTFLLSGDGRIREIHEEVIGLGKKLLQSFEASERDETTEWIINYLAEQMYESESSNELSMREAKNKCFETILTLWQHRSHFPHGSSRPFEQFEPVFRALASLDPEDSYPRYYALPEKEEPNFSEDVRSWVTLGYGLDRTAKSLVSFAFEQAVASAKDEDTANWLSLLHETTQVDEARVLIAKLRGDNTFEQATEKEQKIERYTKRIDQLKAFNSISSALVDDLEEKIKQLKEDANSNF
ncbi:hypothetical protein OGZ01_28705 [Vibrio harveyi]|nr:hypothetical protein [Vibrio harveyi]